MAQQTNAVLNSNIQQPKTENILSLIVVTFSVPAITTEKEKERQREKEEEEDKTAIGVSHVVRSIIYVEMLSLFR